MIDPFDIGPETNSKLEHNLEWHEAAIDDLSEVEGFDESSRVLPSLAWLKLGLLVVCLILVGRMFVVQISLGQAFGSLAEGNRVRNQTILAPRGLIYDSHGVLLVENTASFSLAVTPVDLPTEGKEEIINKVAKDFSLDPKIITDQLEKKGKNKFEPIVVATDLSRAQAVMFETQASDYPGFSVLSIPIREYQKPLIYSHLFGYTSVISPELLTAKADEHYEPNDFIGSSGLELSYESWLRGTNGRAQIEVDAKGRPSRNLGSIDPIPGNSLQLNIDSGLQEVIYDSFTKNNPGIKGAAVAINPKTGQVLALVSLPGFDSNLFAHGISSADYSALLNDSRLPLFDRAISGTYPPGSTIKPVVATAALQEGVVTDKTVIVDKGLLVIPNQFNPSQAYNFYGWKRSGLGPMTVRSAIAESSDIYFYTVAGGYPGSGITALGPNRLADYYRKFNLGSTTGIDLPGEKKGLVADPDWKAKFFADDKILSKWYLGDTYHIGIGQGDMLVTPLQVALWTATIAEGGKAYKPTIVANVKNPSGKIIYETKPEVIVDNVASPENIKIVQEGMRQTVLAGSGRSLSSLPISSAGKTGTSQFDGADPSRTHAWYTSYAPYEDPQIVITVLAEAGGEGHSAAAPVVKDALAWWAQNRYGK